MILDLVDAELLPPPTFFSFSGRGAWCFWLLRHPKDPTSAPAAYPDPRTLWQHIMKATHQRIDEHLPNLNVDRSASDLVRYTRVPGSVNSKSGKTVRFLFPADETAEGFLYTIGELADFFDIDTRPRPSKATRTRTGKSLKKPARGILAIKEHRLRELQSLIDHRGPRLAAGQRRRMTLLWYSFMLSQINQNKTETWVQVLRLAHNCEPPISRSVARRQFESGRKFEKAPNAKIAAELMNIYGAANGINPVRHHVAKLAAVQK